MFIGSFGFFENGEFVFIVINKVLNIMNIFVDSKIAQNVTQFAKSCGVRPLNRPGLG